MSVNSLSKDTFTKQVIESKGVVFVDFFATWCGPCKLTSPIIDVLSAEFKNVTFYKVDVDENSELASQYSIFSIPTFVIFKDGQIVEQFSGAMGKEGFVAQLKKITG